MAPNIILNLTFVVSLLQENVQVALPIVLSKVNFLRNQTYQDFYIYLLIFDLIKVPQIFAHITKV